jgi:hypothetical protein
MNSDPEEVLAEGLLVLLAATLTEGLAYDPQAFADIPWLTPALRARFVQPPKDDLVSTSECLAKLVSRLSGD